ncbi:MAG TPA: RES domain-containing protein [Bacteroidetes bacterium]|nr:RES domain-containing protein [Bacteroidota bacterium]
MNVYRLCKCKYARDLSGRRANIAEGRWNSKGIPILYTAGSRALSIL